MSNCNCLFDKNLFDPYKICIRPVLIIDIARSQVIQQSFKILTFVEVWTLDRQVLHVQVHFSPVNQHL